MDSSRRRAPLAWPGGLRFAADLGALVGGAGAAQAITLVTTLWITRLYTPEHVGPAAFFLSGVAVLASVAALRFDKAIVQASDDTSARQLARLSLLASGGLCVAVALVLVVSTPWIAELPSLSAVGPWLYTLPVVVWLASSSRVVGELRTRAQAFGRLGSARLAGSSVMAASRIGSGLAFGGSVGGYLLGGAASWALQLGLLWERSPRAEDSRSVRSLRETAREYRDFPRYSMPTTFLNRLADQMPTLVLTALFTPEIVGLYALTQRALRSPLDMLAEALQREVRQRCAALHQDGVSLAPLYVSVTCGLALALALPLFGMYAWGESIFGAVFGAEWAQAGAYASAMVPWIGTSLLVPPANAVFFVHRRLRAWLWLEVVSTAGRALVFGVAALSGLDALATITAFSWTCAALNLLVLALGLALARLPGAAEPAP